MNLKILLKLKKELISILKKVAKKLSSDNTINDKNFDNKVFAILRKQKLEKGNIKISFSLPKDKIYTTEGGRSPYDLLIYGKVGKIPFRIFLNNKWGVINSTTRNDVTTYNNLLRLYLNIKTQRLSKETEIDKEVITKRVSEKEIVAYAVFVIDKNTRKHNFFFLEEIKKDDFYVNPRNTMFQIKYNPTLRGSPMTFRDFVLSLINAIIVSLKKSIKGAKIEITVLKGMIPNLRKK